MYGGQPGCPLARSPLTPCVTRCPHSGRKQEDPRRQRGSPHPRPHPQAVESGVRESGAPQAAIHMTGGGARLIRAPRCSGHSLSFLVPENDPIFLSRSYEGITSSPFAPRPWRPMGAPSPSRHLPAHLSFNAGPSGAGGPRSPHPQQLVPAPWRPLGARPGTEVLS